MSWTRFFQRAVGKVEEVGSGEPGRRCPGPTSTSPPVREDSTVQKQSVGTETDLHLVDSLSKVRRRPKASCSSQQEEETSSTTTESSNTDDLSLGERDTHSSKSSDLTSSSSQGGGIGGCRAAKKRGSKTKSPVTKVARGQRAGPANPHQEDNTGFEIKVKGLRKCREQGSGKGPGGDIYQPENLELPYTLRPARPREAERDKEPQQRTPRTPTTAGSSGRSSPMTAWEDPRQDQEPAPLTFTPKPPQSQPQPLAPREPSYSAILLGTDKQKAKVTPFAKVNPEVKRVEKPLGVIGQKAANSHSGSGGLGGLRVMSGPAGTINTTPLLPAPDHHSPPPFSPHPLKEDTYTRSLYSGPHVDTPTSPSIHSWDPKTVSAPSLRPPPGLNQQSHEPGHHHPSLAGEEEWPRYSHMQVTGTLWTEGGAGGSYHHHHHHHHHHPESPTTAPAPSLWDSLSSIWSPPFWGSDQGQTPQLAPQQHHQQQQQQAQQQQQQQQQQPQQPQSPWGSTLQQAPAGNDASGAVSKGLGFDPFHSVGNIWSNPASHPADLWPPPSTKKDV